MDLTHLDLFSGIGGFSLAYEAAGFRTIAHAEIDPYASAVLKKRWPNVPNLGDVTKLCRRAYDCDNLDGTTPFDPNLGEGEAICPRCDDDFASCACIGTDQFLDEYGWPAVITAGFPCQDISVAHNCGGTGKYDRKTKGVAGERSGLVFEVIRIACELGPVFIELENVPNLRTQGADAVLAELERCGYTAGAFVVGSYCAGASHGRDRAHIIAYAQGERVERVRPEGFKISHALAPALLPLRDSHGQWQVEPDLRRAADGIPRWMDRIKCVGNSVQPQIPFYFAQAMRQALEQL